MTIIDEQKANRLDEVYVQLGVTRMCRIKQAIVSDLSKVINLQQVTRNMKKVKLSLCRKQATYWFDLQVL